MAKDPKRRGGTPPKAHQFQPGQSGNPGGRPKKKPSMRDTIIEVLERPVEAIINGRRQEVPLREVIAHQVLSNLANDAENFVRAMRWLEGDRPPAGGAANTPLGDDAEDAAILDAAVAREIRRRQEGGDADD